MCCHGQYIKCLLLTRSFPHTAGIIFFPSPTLPQMVFAALLYKPARQRAMKTSASKAAAEESAPVATPRVVGWLLWVVSISCSLWNRQGGHRVGDPVTPLFCISLSLLNLKGNLQPLHWAFHIIGIKSRSRRRSLKVPALSIWGHSDCEEWCFQTCTSIQAPKGFNCV